MGYRNTKNGVRDLYVYNCYINAKSIFNQGIHIELSILVRCSKKENHDLRSFAEILALESITSESRVVD